MNLWGNNLPHCSPVDRRELAGIDANNVVAPGRNTAQTLPDWGPRGVQTEFLVNSLPDDHDIVPRMSACIRCE